MRRVLLALAYVTGLAVAAVAAGSVLPGSSIPPDPDARLTDSSRLVEVPPTTVGIAFFENRVEARPDDAVSWTALGELYHQLGRETATDAPFARSEQALREAARLAPGYGRAQAALAATLTSRHRFGEAADIATALLSVDPGRAGALAARGDALVSVGRYEEAATDYERLHELDPGPESLARLAHLRELNGDPYGAIELIEDAVGSLDGVTGERPAWFLYRLGDLNRHLGRWTEARRAFHASLQRLDQFPLALEGLADVAMKTDALDEAEQLLERLAAVSPGAPAWLLQADLAALRGDAEASAELLARSIDWLEALDPTLAGRDLARVLADNDIRVDAALAHADAELDRRPDVFSYDLAAWARLRSGDVVGARSAIDQALVLGTLEPSFLYHSALIATAEGDELRARLDLERALDINPDFDPFDAPAAAVLLAELS